MRFKPWTSHILCSSLNHRFSIAGLRLTFGLPEPVLYQYFSPKLVAKLCFIWFWGSPTTKCWEPLSIYSQHRFNIFFFLDVVPQQFSRQSSVSKEEDDEKKKVVVVQATSDKEKVTDIPAVLPSVKELACKFLPKKSPEPMPRKSLKVMQSVPWIVIYFPGKFCSFWAQANFFYWPRWPKKRLLPFQVDRLSSSFWHIDLCPP